MAFTAGCENASSGSSAEESGTIQLWTLQSDLRNPVTNQTIEEFNKNSKVKVEMSVFANDPYKQKLQESMGSPSAPDIFFNWGGGNLAQFVEAGQVVDITKELNENREVADAFIPSVLEVGKINGKQYGLPTASMQPVILFYNKEVFASAGVQPPKTYDDLLALIDVFKARSVIPIALAGSQGWTELMYLMNLVDRIGGQQKYTEIAAGKSGAWRDPAVLKALELCQDLAKRGAFGSNFSTVNYDNTGAGKLFATGKAAMHLMGTWEYSNQSSNNPDFASRGLGWTAFPSVSGGVGDPRNVVGAPSNYYSVSTSSKHKAVAIEFLMKTLTERSQVEGMLKAGEIPAVRGAEKLAAGLENAEFTTFVYDFVSKAPAFTPAWDQGLSPAEGNAVNANLQKLFLGQITPEQFATAMELVK